MKRAASLSSRVSTAIQRWAMLTILTVMACFGAVSASAQTTYTPETVTIESLFDYADLALVFLGVVGVAYAALVGVKLAIGIAMRVAGKMGARV